MFRIACYGAFISALSLCNQHTIVFYLFPIIVSILYILLKTHELNSKRFFQLTFLFLAGLLPYAYLVIDSYFPKKASWGDAHTLYGKNRPDFWHRILQSSPSIRIRNLPIIRGRWLETIGGNVPCRNSALFFRFLESEDLIGCNNYRRICLGSGFYVRWSGFRFAFRAGKEASEKKKSRFLIFAGSIG